MPVTGDERGSVLALVPAAFLVLVVLGALAADSAVAYLGQQQLHDALSAAANDAVAAALSDRSFYSAGRVALDPAAVDSVVCQAVQAQEDTGLHDLHLAVAISRRAVQVSGSATVDAVFGRALSGFATRSVHSSASAVITDRAGNQSLPAFSDPLPIRCPP